MGMLDGGIEALFGEAFAGLYLPAVLHRDGTEPEYDERGRITGYSDAADIDCRAQVDAASYAMRQTKGFAEGDVRIIVLSAGLGIAITTDYAITVSGKRWLIASVERDAANSHYILRGRRA